MPSSASSVDKVNSIIKLVEDMTVQSQAPTAVLQSQDSAWFPLLPSGHTAYR